MIGAVQAQDSQASAGEKPRSAAEAVERVETRRPRKTSADGPGAVIEVPWPRSTRSSSSSSGSGRRRGAIL